LQVLQPHREELLFGKEEVIIESARRHGTFDGRYPIRRKIAAPAWELQRDWDHRGRLDWAAFVAGSFPNGRRHDFPALAAYVAYGNAFDRATSLRRSPMRGPASPTEIARGDDSRPPALAVWESEGGSVGRRESV
jgi:hypothetical protein